MYEHELSDALHVCIAIRFQAHAPRHLSAGLALSFPRCSRLYFLGQMKARESVDPVEVWGFATLAQRNDSLACFGLRAHTERQ